MAFLRKFVVELIVVAILVGWVVGKFPDAVTPRVPWLCFAVFWHPVWEVVPKNWIFAHREKTTMIYVAAFVIGGFVSVCLI
jgi:hypothetical protein